MIVSIALAGTENGVKIGKKDLSTALRGSYGYVIFSLFVVRMIVTDLVREFFLKHKNCN